MKQYIESFEIENAPTPLKVKGHMSLEFKNVKTGEVEVVEQHNMQTNALAEYLTNCGWMNSDNVNRSNLIKQLLGGVMLFDGTISENASIVKVPAGLTMTANGCVDVSNGSATGDPTEMGSYVEADSGLQQDGSYVMTWEWQTGQGNGVISSAGLTSYLWGYSGEGNASGLSRTSKESLRNLNGSISNLTYPEGLPTRVSIVDSSFYTVDLSDLENAHITIRKYLAPITKINLKGTMSSPVLVSEQTITAPANMVTLRASLYHRDNYDKFYLYNAGPRETRDATWGNGHTQYLWELDVVNATITEEIIANTSGVTLYEMFNPFFVGSNYIVFCNGHYLRQYVYRYCDSRTIYVLNRTSKAITAISNPYGREESNSSDWQAAAADANWWNPFDIRDNRVIVAAYSGRPNLIVDLTGNGTVRLTNSNEGSAGAVSNDDILLASTDKALVGASYLEYVNRINLYRKPTYLATIWNASSAYTKTAEKTMRLVYRLTFEESQGTNS